MLELTQRFSSARAARHSRQRLRKGQVSQDRARWVMPHWPTGLDRGVHGHQAEASTTAEARSSFLFQVFKQGRTVRLCGWRMGALVLGASQT